MIHLWYLLKVQALSYQKRKLCLTSEYLCQWLGDLEATILIEQQWCSWPKHPSTHIWFDEEHLVQEFPSAHVPLAETLTHHAEVHHLTQSLSADVEILLDTLILLHKQKGKIFCWNLMRRTRFKIICNSMKKFIATVSNTAWQKNSTWRVKQFYFKIWWTKYYEL
jgi:hypothetical protein